MSTRRDGPTTLTTSYQSCSGCTFHEQHMRRSGQNPIYDHYCGHPDINIVKWGSVFDPNKAWIGDSDRTPRWCPFLGGDRPSQPIDGSPLAP